MHNLRMTQYTNADASELDKFASHAHHWWDSSGPLHTLHAINPLRLDWISSIAPVRGARIVDVGCGGGLLSEGLAKAGAASVLGIDLASKSIKVAQLHAMEAGLANLQYQTVSAEELATQQAGQHDMVTCMEMLEHVPDPASIVQACADLVRPGGWVLFSTINQSPKAFLHAILGAEYLLGMVPKGTHEFAKLIPPATLAGMCRSSGLDVHSMTGLTYSPLSQRYRLTPSVEVNYFLAARKPGVAA